MRNNIKIKNNLLLIIVLIVLNTLLLLGLNYYYSLMNFFDKMISNNSTFNKVIISLNGNYNYKELKKKIENNSHVISVWNNLEHEGFGKIISPKLGKMDGGIIIESINTNTNRKKIINGSIPSKEYELLCPNNFFPDYAYVNKYDYFKQINIENYLNNMINIKYYDELETKFKLVGIYDNAFDYTAPNVCYTTSNTLSKLNLLSKNELDETMIIAELDDINNIDELYSIENVSSIDRMATINQSIIDSAVKIINILLFSLFTVVILSIYLIYSRSIISNLRNIGILLIVGFTKNKIKNIYYHNSVKVGILSVTVSMIVSIILSRYFTLLLHNKVGLALMEININYYTILISYLITFLCLFVSSYFTLIKIDNLEINEVLYD